MKAWGVLPVIALVVVAAGCSSSGEGGREVIIVQRDDGCSPTRIQAEPGEKLKLVVKNEASDDYEIEGIEGTKLDEVVVPEGRTRTPGYNVPADGGTHKIKCYTPGGNSTIIEVVTQASGNDEATSPRAGAEPESDPDPEADD